MTHNRLATTQCPCGLPNNYDACCGVFIAGKALPPTPEALMRSRYTAFAKANIEYIIDTMKAPAATGFNPEQARTWALTNTWLGLEVKNSSAQTKRGYVEFLAHFSRDGKADYLHEISEFRKDDGKWFYIDGEGPRKRSSLTK
ncbi:MAG: YchJ family metal-binding protein [Pseudomonadota bacterium]